MMLRFASLVLAVCAVHVVLAAPQTAPTSRSSYICDGYGWGVTIERLESAPIPVYNQYVRETTCAGPAWVQSSTMPEPPRRIQPWGTTYDCEVPAIQYYCGNTSVATCCGKFSVSA